MKSLLGVGAALLAAGCSTVGVRSGTEEPSYESVARVGELEIRRYSERVVAQTVVGGTSDDARNGGFRRLASYIFGDNNKSGSIAMTAPVAQSEAVSQTIAMTAPVSQSPAANGRWTIQFFMPSAYAISELPIPNDPTIELVVVPSETYAVLRFNGVGSPQVVEARKAELLGVLRDTQWQMNAEPVVWFYDPPWTLPPLRRNEVAVRVVRN